MALMLSVLLFLSYNIEEAHATPSANGFCSHIILKDQNFSNIHKEYGFLYPFENHYLTQTKGRNKHIKNLAKIYAGQKIYLPVQHQYKSNSSNLQSCDQLAKQTWKSKKSNTLDPKIREPSSETVKKENKSNRSILAVSLSGVFESIHSNNQNQKTILISDLQPSLSIGLQRFISNNWLSVIKGQYLQQSYLGTQNSSISLSQKNFTTSSLDFGLQYSWEKSSFFQFTLGFGDFAYYKSLTSTQYDLITNQVANINVRFSQTIVDYEPFRGNLLFSLGYTGNSQKDNTEFIGGLDHGIGLDLNFSLTPNQNFSIIGFYEQGQYKSNVGGFEKRWLWTSLIYKVRF